MLNPSRPTDAESAALLPNSGGHHRQDSGRVTFLKILGPPMPVSRPHRSPTRGGTKDKTLAAEILAIFGPTDARKSAALLPNSGGHHKFHCGT